MFGWLKGMLESALDSLTGPSLRGTVSETNENMLFDRLSEAIGRHASMISCNVKFKIVCFYAEASVYDTFANSCWHGVFDDLHETCDHFNQQVALEVAFINGDEIAYMSQLCVGNCRIDDNEVLNSLYDEAQIIKERLVEKLMETHPGIKFQFIEDPLT
jgi:hypothetical protein